MFRKLCARFLMLLVAASCLGADAPEKRQKATAVQPPRHEPSPLPGLENVMRAGGDFYSGGEPKGEQAFAVLKQLGIKTIVSVDGIRPNIEAAQRHGIRTVHIPIGYDGIDPLTQATLTRVARDIEGPVYVHCHHGKHRGPAATAIICQAAGVTDSEGGLDILRRGGTSARYDGLFRDVREFQPLADDAKLPELVEVASLSDMASGMARLDRQFELLTKLSKNEWKPIAQHPDLVPGRQALLVSESLFEMTRALPDDADRDLRRQFVESTRFASAMERALREGDLPTASSQFKLVTQRCDTCHQDHRD